MMAAMALDVAVQVVNYRTARQLATCLQSVLDDVAPSGPAVGVFVLDNASGDDLSDAARRHPEVVFSTAERNLGFGAGHNRLAAEHDAGALLLLNPDAELIEPATVARLLAVLRSDRAVAAVGPQLVSSAGAVDLRDHGELHGLRARVARAAGHSHYRRRNAPADAAWVSGAACLVDRRAFDAVGGLTPASSSTRRRRTCSCASGGGAGGSATSRPCASATTGRRSPRGRSISTPPSGGSPASTSAPPSSAG